MQPIDFILMLLGALRLAQEKTSKATIRSGGRGWGRVMGTLGSKAPGIINIAREMCSMWKATGSARIAKM